MSMDQGINVMSNDKTVVCQGLGYDKQAVMPYRTTKGVTSWQANQICKHKLGFSCSNMSAMGSHATT
jgi:hypothetical protein